MAFAAPTPGTIGVIVDAQAPGQKLQKTTVCVATNDQVKAGYTRTNGQAGTVSFFVQAAPPGVPKGLTEHFDWKLTQLQATDQTGDQAMGAIAYWPSNKPLAVTYGLAPDQVDIKIWIKSGCGI